MFKDLKKINYTPYLLVVGGFSAILLFMNSLRVVSDLSDTNKVSETMIEMPSVPSPEPSVSSENEEVELDQNTKALNARSEILAKADVVYSQILGTTKAIDEQRALSWLLFAKKEAHKTQQTSREYLTSKLLSKIEELRALTNNQWLTTTTDKAKEFYWIAGEARAILIALTQTPTGSGADEKILISELFDSLNQSYSSLINENNLVRFESQEVLKRNLVGPANKPSKKTELENPDSGGAKAEENDFHEDNFQDEAEVKPEAEVKQNN